MPPLEHGPEDFFLDTCLRQLLIPASTDTHAGATTCNNTVALQGRAAYRFLLETAAGLNSAIPGETNIFGQFQRAWKIHQNDATAASLALLTPLFEQLFADCRLIRKTWLEGIGGASYGTLVRKLCGADSRARVLFVGAGDLAQSILPYFEFCETAVWNHRPFTAARKRRVFAPEFSAQAANWANHVVLTTPSDSYNDELWFKLLASTSPQTVVHLGRRKAERGPWTQQRGFFDLDDVFALRQQQTNVRSLNISRARKACANIATQRISPSTREQQTVQALA
ncbi:MAG: hypothetical protein ACR2P6_05485 [Gammaproteobacteria bacterium]